VSKLKIILMKNYKTLFHIASNFFVKKGYSYDEAKDYASDVFCKLYKYKEKHKKTDLDLAKILKRSLKNYYIDLLRKKYKRVKVENETLQPEYDYIDKKPEEVVNKRNYTLEYCDENYLENFEDSTPEPNYRCLYEYISEEEINIILIRLRKKHTTININYFKLFYFKGYSDIEICNMYKLELNSTIRVIKIKVREDFVNEAKELLKLVK